MENLCMRDVVNIDLNKGLSRTYAGMVLATGDRMANCFGAALYRGGDAVDITGYAVTGYFIRKGNAETVLIEGKAQGNEAIVELPQACYTSDGSFSLAIKVSGADVTATVRVVDGAIRLTQTGTLIDPGDVVPSLDELFAQIAEMEAVTAEGEETIATIKADTAAAIAETMDAAADTRAATQELSAVTAPPIIPTVTGEIVAVSDSAHRPLAGLRLYGKTTQDGTPSPVTPVPLVSVGDGGSIATRVCGKNLMTMPNQSFSNAGVTFTANADGSISVSGTVSSTAAVNYYFYSRSVARDYGVYLPAGTYVLSLRDANGNAVGGGGFGAYYWLESDPATRKSSQTYSNNTSITITLAEGARVQPMFYFSANVATNKTVYCQIERGSTETARESLKDGGSVTASTPNGLPGIPVDSGGNYTDANGQQWLCDEVDFGRGVYVQRVGQTVFTGEETLRLWSDSQPAIYRYDVSNIKRTADNYSYNGVRSSHLTQSIAATVANTLLLSSIAVPGIASCLLFQITIDGANISGLDAAKAYLKAQYEAGTPMQVVYQLASPVEKPLSADELAAYGALTCQKPNTTVCNDAGAGMQVDYIADTQLYIDNKFSALEAALLSTGANV